MAQYGNLNPSFNFVDPEGKAQPGRGGTTVRPLLRNRPGNGNANEDYMATAANKANSAMVPGSPGDVASRFGWGGFGGKGGEAKGASPMQTASPVAAGKPSPQKGTSGSMGQASIVGAGSGMRQGYGAMDKYGSGMASSYMPAEPADSGIMADPLESGIGNADYKAPGADSDWLNSLSTEAANAPPPAEIGDEMGYASAPTHSDVYGGSENAPSYQAAPSQSGGQRSNRFFSAIGKVGKGLGGFARGFAGAGQRGGAGRSMNALY